MTGVFNTPSHDFNIIISLHKESLIITNFIGNKTFICLKICFYWIIGNKIYRLQLTDFTQAEI